MGDKSKIEWTDATWNPIVGCSVVSPGCTNCYAMKDAYRKGFNPKTPQYHGLTRLVNGKAVWTGDVATAREETMNAPLRWRRPRRIFVNSMGDLFHESVPEPWIDQVVRVMLNARTHTFQVLTKRARRMRDYFAAFEPDGEGFVTRGGQRAMGAYPKGWPIFADNRWPAPHIHLGVSAEDQPRAEERIRLLLQTTAAVRFVSGEPLLGSIDLGPIVREATLAGRICPDGKTHPIGWVIAGGESGPGARPMHPDWVRSLRDQCAAAGVPFFFKQWGDWHPARHDPSGVLYQFDGCGPFDSWKARVFDPHQTEGINFRLIGKKVAGALLDGCEHREFPA